MNRTIETLVQECVDGGMRGSLIAVIDEMERMMQDGASAEEAFRRVRESARDAAGLPSRREPDNGGGRP